MEGIGGCCSTGAESEICQLFSSGSNSFSNNASYDKESKYVFFCLNLLCFNLDIIVVILEAVVQLELNLKHRNSSERNKKLLLY